MTKPSAGVRRLLLGAVLTCGVLGLLLWREPPDARTTRLIASPNATLPAATPGASPRGPSSTVPNPAVRQVLPAPAVSITDTPPPEDEYSRMLTELNHTDKPAALVLAEKGEQWYPPVGRLAEARRAMRITLLVDLDRMAEARALTREFIERHPESPYRRLVQGATGIHPRPSGPRPAASR